MSVLGRVTAGLMVFLLALVSDVLVALAARVLGDRGSTLDRTGVSVRRQEPLSC